MKKLLCVAVLGLMLTGSASALSISVYDPMNSPITSFSWTQTGYQVDIYEVWTGPGRGFLLFDDVEQWADYTIYKHITNATGVDWNLFSNELLDPYDGTGSEDDVYDPQPYPGWVPARFSTSSDMDGLSFAQGSPIPKTSTAFTGVLVDELSNARDFIEFYDGLVSGIGGTDLESFGLRDNDHNQPFLLAQRPNEHSLVPEPGTLMLLGSGLLGLGIFRRKK